MSSGDEVSGGPDPYRTVAQMVPGQTIMGRYTLGKILGRGGFGVVWQVHDNELEMDIAIKFLSDIIVSNPEAIDDLKRETKFSLRLTHPNIVRIYGFVQDPTVAGISMEYIEGGTLSALKVKRESRCFDTETLAPLTERLCDALDYAHKRVKIAHRDLKPGNLMVDASGDLKIADFGISRSISDTQTALTRVSSTGTPAFMSPQQMMGDPASHSDDIYSLGGTLYDLLAGKPPFYTGNIIEQVRMNRPISIQARREELGIDAPPVAPEWEAVILACLEKEPADRPQSAAEVADRLGLRISGASTLPIAIAGTEGGGGGGDGQGTAPGSRIPTSSMSIPSAGETNTGGRSSSADASHQDASGIGATGMDSPDSSRSQGSDAGAKKPSWWVPAAVLVVGGLAVGGWWFSRAGDSAPSPDPVAAVTQPASGASGDTPADRPGATGNHTPGETPINDEHSSESGDSFGAADTETPTPPEFESKDDGDSFSQQDAKSNALSASEGVSGDVAVADVGISSSVPDEEDGLAREIEDSRDRVTGAVRRGDWDAAESALARLHTIAPTDDKLSHYGAQIADGREVQTLRREIPRFLAAHRLADAETALSQLQVKRPGDRDASRWKVQLAALNAPESLPATNTGSHSGAAATASSDQDEILSLLRSYEAALESVQIDRFVALWANLPQKKRSGFEKAFRGIKSQSIEWRGTPEISIDGEEAVVNLREQRSMIMNAGSDHNVEINSRIVLVKTAAGWKIKDLEAR